jgi:hypothetical protein
MSSKEPRRGKLRGGLPGADDPAVLLDVELDGGRLWLVLANDSNQPAFDVSVDFEQSLNGAGGDLDVTGLPIFRGLGVLRRGREVRIFIDLAEHFFKREKISELRARVSWESREGKRFAQGFRHDLIVWKDFGEIG